MYSKLLLFCYQLALVVTIEQLWYYDRFAVHVSSGENRIRNISRKHNFVFHGMIGNLNGFYLLSHLAVRKRTILPSTNHIVRLQNEPEVLWVYQQNNLIRIKRNICSFAGQPYQQTTFSDPLYKDQWYLNLSYDMDMHIKEAWSKGYDGKGIIVTVLDDGIQTNHPDLLQNYDSKASIDINGNDTDPSPRDDGDNKHGTRCAGEIASVVFNEYCGVGVAFKANIGGVRMLDGLVDDAVEAHALSFNHDYIDIYSASWGPEDDGATVDGPGPLAERALINGITNGRKGRGSIFVWASGNGGRNADCCSCDGYASSPYTISVSSVTSNGEKLWYLEECPSTIACTYSSGRPGIDNQIVTTDVDLKRRTKYICTKSHTGSSASAPIAAGIAALTLQSNANLTWRDMQYIIVLTSRYIPLQNESGWKLNGAHRNVSHKFGYGLMDAAAMVKLAENWETLPTQHICQTLIKTVNQPIQNFFGFTLNLQETVSGCQNTINEINYLEHVQCRVTLMYFPRGDLEITLTSPMGTTSTLLSERHRDTNASTFENWPFLSLHYWGEKPQGRWILQVINKGNLIHEKPGLFKSWQLILFGTSEKPVHT